jgi:D-sedoheptulose 7-phosphate isomerase
MSRDASAFVSGHLHASAETMVTAADAVAGAVARAAEAVTGSLRGGGKLMVCGNGGSAADAQHLAAELVGHFDRAVHRPGLAAIALTTDTSLLTAIGNDDSFDLVFERQVTALGRSGDVLLCISTSGNSANITRAAGAARAAGLTTISLTGEGGALEGGVDIPITIPSRETQLIQEVMLAIEHVLVGLVERALYPRREL